MTNAPGRESNAGTTSLNSRPKSNLSLCSRISSAAAPNTASKASRCFHLTLVSDAKAIHDDCTKCCCRPVSARWILRRWNPSRRSKQRSSIPAPTLPSATRYYISINEMYWPCDTYRDKFERGCAQVVCVRIVVILRDEGVRAVLPFALLHMVLIRARCVNSGYSRPRL